MQQRQQRRNPNEKRQLAGAAPSGGRSREHESERRRAGAVLSLTSPAPRPRSRTTLSTRRPGRRRRRRRRRRRCRRPKPTPHVLHLSHSRLGCPWGQDRRREHVRTCSILQRGVTCEDVQYGLEPPFASPLRRFDSPRVEADIFSDDERSGAFFICMVVVRHVLPCLVPFAVPPTARAPTPAPTGRRRRLPVGPPSHLLMRQDDDDDGMGRRRREEGRP
jgi:hypothetical protein